jgi:hypothetical protein
LTSTTVANGKGAKCNPNRAELADSFRVALARRKTMDNQVQDEAREVGEKVSANRSLNLVTVELVVAEYNTLRDEILRASDRKIQLATIATIAIGTLFAAGIQSGNAYLILVFPILAAAVAALWAAEDRTIQTIGAYIQKTIEEERAGIDNLSWEHFVAAHPWVFRINYWIGGQTVLSRDISSGNNPRHVHLERQQDCARLRERRLYSADRL